MVKTVSHNRDGSFTAGEPERSLSMPEYTAIYREEQEKEAKEKEQAASKETPDSLTSELELQHEIICDLEIQHRDVLCRRLVALQTQHNRQRWEVAMKQAQANVAQLAKSLERTYIYVSTNGNGKK